MTNNGPVTVRHRVLMLRAATTMFVMAGLSMASLWFDEATYQPGRGPSLSTVLTEFAATGVLMCLAGALTTWAFLHSSIEDNKPKSGSWGE